MKTGQEREVPSFVAGFALRQAALSHILGSKCVLYE
jgi:hypothetical protein